MRQRVVIALALCAGPRLIVADEPTTALDVSIQAQIIALLKRLCREHGTAVMLVTHDMGVIAETADRVAVMYAGRIVEIGPVRDVVKHAKHPYTKGLMGSIPSLGVRHDRLTQIDGAMPRLTEIPPGCAFNPRCTVRGQRCLRRAAGPDVGRHQPRRLLAARSRRRRRAGRPRSWSMPDAPLSTGGTSQFVRIAGLKRYFDVSAPWLVRKLEGRPRQIVQAVDGIDIEIAKGETFSLVGEIGLRQVDGGAPGGRALSADRGLDRVRRQRHGGAAQPQRHGGAAPAHADDLPGPVRQPQSALARVRHHRRADPRLRAVDATRPTSRSGSANCCARSS